MPALFIVMGFLDSADAEYLHQRAVTRSRHGSIPDRPFACKKHGVGTGRQRDIEQQHSILKGQTREGRV